MTIKELFKLRSQINVECERLLINKGADYSGEEDTLNNLRMGGIFGIVTRMGDKLWRLHNLCFNLLKTGNDNKQVKDESLRDTVYDIRNYCDLFLALYTETIENPQETEQGINEESIEVPESNSKPEQKGNGEVSNTGKSVAKPAESVGIVTGVYGTQDI